MSPLKQMFVIGVLYFFFAPAAAICKTLPSSLSPTVWAALNITLGGQLIRPTALAAPCHPDQLSYNTGTCATIQGAWSDYPIHRSNPVSSAWQNFNNDTCLPTSYDTCTTNGYPSYVINATTELHVQIGVAFAFLHNIRVTVKGTGHDFLGRSSSFNTLSIWTYNLKGLSFHNSFKPLGCTQSIPTTAATVSAGQVTIEVYTATAAVNQTLVGGEADGVGIGGYLTGGGHSALSHLYGMAADNVLELRMVTPQGLLITANECQNTDLFFAMRGGGGGTFGVITSATVKTYPTMPVAIHDFSIITATTSDAYWDIVAYLISQYPSLADQGIMGYPYAYPNVQIAPGVCGNLLGGKFHDHNSAYGASNISAVMSPIWTHILSTFGPSILQFSNTTTSFPNRLTAFQNSRDTNPTGSEAAVGSRLLSAEVLGGDQAKLRAALKGFMGDKGAGLYLLGGRGVRDAVPRGGSDAVHPAWRKALGHFITGATWEPKNVTDKNIEMASLHERVQFLRDLEPGSGAYVNEATPDEPDFQTTFWGSNYAKLLAIKRLRDPTDVFWCTPCVGNERWKIVGDGLCTV